VKTGSAPFFLRAGTTSGLPLSYAVLTGPATISSGGLVTLTGVPGTVTVKISQAGGSGYNPTEAYVTFPVTMAGQEFVKLARGGASHSAGIRADGTLWAWGYNISGQVGDGTQTNRNSPVQVGTATNWAAVACGGAHTVALKNDGTLWAWGTSSALGDGSGLPRSSPVQVGNASDWATVAAGFSHTVAVKSDGTLWAWGSNGAGQVGDGTTAERYSPVRIGTASHWATVACGNNYSVAMGSDGTLWAWGNNFNGQLAVC
jgi:alpha-tubulin suppressor-like RCC1 family protein